MVKQDTSKTQSKIKAGKVGNSMKITIPKHHAQRLNIEEGDTIKMQAEEGKHGTYASIWNATKQDTEQ